MRGPPDVAMGEGSWKSPELERGSKRDEAMMPPRGPDALSWAAAVFRGLHPVRWALGLLGLAATVSVAAGLQAFWERDVPRLGEWFRDPVAEVQALTVHLAGRSFAGLVVRLSVLLTIVTAIWGIIGAWIARHELVGRHRGQPYTTPGPIEPGPTGLVARHVRRLVVACPVVLILCAVLLIPVALAGLLNHIGGVGAILVALVLPVVLIADLILLCLAVGLVAWPLMPVTIAAENSDEFDALSRAYNYAYQRPIRFALLTAATVALAAMPVAIVLYLLAGPVENWAAAAGHPAVWVAAGLSASIYWSVQTLAYLDLRASVDATDPYEIASEPEPGAVPAPPAPAEGQPPTAEPKPAKWAGPGPLGHVLIVGFMVVTWVVTAWLFARFGGENTGWLGWGMGGQFMPAAQGYYLFAALLAGLWGVLWIAAPFIVMLRRAVRGETTPANESPPGPTDGNASAESLLQ